MHVIKEVVANTTQLQINSESKSCWTICKLNVTRLLYIPLERWKDTSHMSMYENGMIVEGSQSSLQPYFQTWDHVSYNLNPPPSNVEVHLFLYGDKYLKDILHSCFDNPSKNTLILRYYSP